MLIVFEGNFGLGKSTQINTIYDWLKTIPGANVVLSEWNSVPEIRNLYSFIEKDRGLRNSLLYIYFQLLDFIFRYDFEILPALKDNSIVICDRYYYTILARADVRGLDLTPLKKINETFIFPDYTFYLDGSAELSRSRVAPRGQMRNEVWSVGINNKLDKMTLDEIAYMNHLELNLQSYRKIMYQDGVIWLDASSPPNLLSRNIEKLIQEGLKENGTKETRTIDCV